MAFWTTATEPKRSYRFKVILGEFEETSADFPEWKREDPGQYEPVSLCCDEK